MGETIKNFAAVFDPLEIKGSAMSQAERRQHTVCCLLVCHFMCIMKARGLHLYDRRQVMLM